MAEILIIPENRFERLKVKSMLLPRKFQGNTVIGEISVPSECFSLDVLICMRQEGFTIFTPRFESGPLGIKLPKSR